MKLVLWRKGNLTNVGFLARGALIPPATLCNWILLKSTINNSQLKSDTGWIDTMITFFTPLVKRIEVFQCAYLNIKPRIICIEVMCTKAIQIELLLSFYKNWEAYNQKWKWGYLDNEIWGKNCFSEWTLTN